MMRRVAGVTLFLLGTLFWFGAMVADPYTAWGVGHEQIRPGVARIGINLAASAMILLALAGATVFTVAANRRGWKAVAFASALLFFFATAAARLVWVQFVVLA